MNSRKNIAAAILTSLLLVATGFITKSFALDSPKCTLSSNQDSGNRHVFHTSLSWSGGWNGWHLLYWGDEAQTGNGPIGYFGSSGSANWDHFYNQGTWDQWTHMSGPGGTAQCVLKITIEGQSDPATCSISITKDGSNPQLFHTTVGWDRAYDGWHAFYWGDESQTGNGPVGFYGRYGSVSWDHVYNPGTWDQWTNVHGPGGVGQCKVVTTVEATQGTPSCTITANQDGSNPLLYHTTISWSGGWNGWHTMYWGDEAQTGNGPVGYFGSSGSTSWDHLYESGTWQQWSNLAGPGGWNGCLVTTTASQSS